jgi:hypothetical protein
VSLLNEALALSNTSITITALPASILLRVMIILLKTLRAFNKHWDYASPFALLTDASSLAWPVPGGGGTFGNSDESCAEHAQ